MEKYSSSKNLSSIKGLSSVLALLFLFTQSFGQFEDQIASDRPGQSIGSATVGKKILQFQTGYAVGSNIISIGSNKGVINLRYGILERLEIGFLAANDANEFPVINEPQIWTNTFQFGTRYSLLENKDWVPALAAQVMFSNDRMNNSISSQVLEENNHSTVSVVSASWSLPQKLSFTTNIIWSQNYTQNASDLGYTANLTLGTRLGSFVELYGSFTGNVLWNTGLFYTATDDLKFDIGYAGVAVENEISLAPNSIVDFGLSYRLNWRE